MASVAIAWLAGQEAGLATFFVFAGMAAASGLSLLLIRRDDFDQERARGTPLRTTEASIWSLLRDRRLLLLCLALTLFHLGNAAMLPLLGQRIAKFGNGNATRWLAICIIVAQFAMIIVAAAASWAASRIRRSWLFVIPCCVLPVRGLMAAFGWSVEWLIPIQILDACGAGLLGVSVPILVADYSLGVGSHSGRARRRQYLPGDRRGAVQYRGRRAGAGNGLELGVPGPHRSFAGRVYDRVLVA